MNAICPRIVIAGTGSGVGKTSLALGLIRAFTRRGLKVQPFKTGPDFLDPTYLTLAAGKTCYNLDGWMTGCEYVRELFARKTADADIAVIEGVMGMFDGVSATSIESSTAEIALWLDSPVLLAVNVHGMAGSIAAVVKGFSEFQKNVNIKCVVANRCGSEGHKNILRQALDTASLPPLVGGIPEDAFPTLPSRHLGLVTADRQLLNTDILNKLADVCEQNLDLEKILTLAKMSSAFNIPPSPSVQKETKVQVGIARDEAFHFYYPDNLEILEQLGAELVYFSPLHDPVLPNHLHALYIGGGYPEEYAQPLSQNIAMIQSIQSFASSHRPIYAECGGLMYLGEIITDHNESSFSMLGLLPLSFTMQKKLRSLGYVEVTLNQNSLWGQVGDILRGHEFHYSDAYEPEWESVGYEKIYSLKNHSGKIRTEGYQKENILASYVHLHFASNPTAINHFLKLCRETDREI